MKEFIAIMVILSIILLFLVFALMIIGILIEMIKEIKQWTKRKLVNNMKEYQVDVYNVYTGKIIDTFIGEFQSVDELRDFMDSELHNYNEPYLKLHYHFTEG